MLTIVKAIPDAEDRPYRADELLVELAILGQPGIRGRLAAVLSPLDAGTDLRRTLEVLLACNLDRERAARELWIHRRTLHYRLDRIRDLSGVDPSSARGIQLFRAALTSARLAGLERDGHRAQDASLPPPLSA
ncbi:helix-turn-helix domain-containing protein [Actinomadura madurae]|uniref:PucR family transcriptional regulator n=1 Tax=Actinomadura madurae TaxID=1993 RepID=UPI0020D1F71E|nr:helix-turn-helix domain-containing protein [Actinomadura madurae]MCP9955131.1 helix-turn-helix domain-containing protein [Actinomadura madurae]